MYKRITITGKDQTTGHATLPRACRVARDPRWLDHFDDPNK